MQRFEFLVRPLFLLLLCNYMIQKPWVSTTAVSTYADFSLCTYGLGGISALVMSLINAVPLMRILSNLFFSKKENVLKLGNKCTYLLSPCFLLGRLRCLCWTGLSFAHFCALLRFTWQISAQTDNHCLIKCFMCYWFFYIHSHKYS